MDRMHVFIVKARRNQKHFAMVSFVCDNEHRTQQIELIDIENV